MEKLEKTLKDQTDQNDKLRSSLEKEKSANSALKDKLINTNTKIQESKEILGGKGLKLKNQEQIKTL